MKNPRDDLAAALQPLLIFSKIFGLYPGRITSDEKLLKKCNSKDIFDVLWSVTVIISLTLYSACTMKTGENPLATSQLITEIGDTIYMSVSLLSALVIGLVALINRNKMRAFLQKLKKFDRRMQRFHLRLDVRREYVVTRRYTITAVTLVFTSMVAYITVDVALFLERVTIRDIGAEVITYVYPLVTTNLMVLQFGVMAMLIKQKFKWINIKLEEIRRNWHESIQNSIGPISANVTGNTEVTADLENLRHRHYELCSIGEYLNEIYNVPLLVSTLNLFISLTFTMYFCFISNSNAKQRYPDLYAVYYVLNGLINGATLLGMVRVSSLAKREAKLTGEILQTICGRTEEIENFVIHFSLQLAQNNLEFSVCKMFVLDESLLFSVIGAITIYLVIVVQFQYQDISM